MKKKILSLIILAVTLLTLAAHPVVAGAAAVNSVAGRVATSSGSLNVCRSASTSSEIITSLYKGSYLTLMWQSGDWWYVEFDDGKYGYCHSDYIQTVGAITHRETVRTSIAVNLDPSVNNPFPVRQRPSGPQAAISTSAAAREPHIHGSEAFRAVR